MFAQLRRALLLSGFVLLVACSAWAQTTTLEGDVKGVDGQPLKGAVIKLDRTDIKGHYQVKSDKKGHWLYTGLPFGKYDISCEVDGQVVDKVSGVQSAYGESKTVDFDAGKAKQAQQAAAKAVASGQAAPDVERGMTKEQKDKYEAQVKQQSEAMKKNKALNDAFVAGKASLDAAGADQDKAKKTADYQAAVDGFNKASDLADTDVNKVAVFDNLGEAYAGLAATQTGDDKTKSYDQAIAAYNKGLAIKPNDAAIYNQLGNIYGAEKKIPEATEALNKAAQLDPTMAPKAYFNMGANLVNSGNNDQASEFFKKAIDADPNYADAHYQYGITLMAKATVDNKTGKVTPPEGTAEQFQKYLELKPDGPYAQPSKDMLASLGETVQTSVGKNIPAGKKKSTKQ